MKTHRDNVLPVKMSGKGTSLKSIRRSRQTGQALPLGLAFVLVGMLGALVLFNTGQVAVDKQRLANASDSAAYSGMVWQARALNFQAYSNRAMVANQVSMGQAVSLASWANYAAQTSINARAVLGGIPFVGQFIATMATMIQTISESIVKPIAQGMVTVIGPINKAVALSQQTMFASSFGATPDIVRDVAKASDSRFTTDTAYSALGLTNNLSQWKNFTQTYTLDDISDMAERTKLVNDSRDPFSKARYWDFFDNFWVYSTPFTKHKVFREGETRLVMVDRGGEPAWEWMGMDTVALETRIWRPFRSSRRIEVPMGWGAAYANNNGENKIVVNECNRRSLRATDCQYFNRNDQTAELAVAQIDSLNSYTGINEFRSISQSIRDLDDGEAVLRLKAEVSMDLDTVKSSDKVINNREPFVTPMVSPADKLSSISVAEVYYRRPEAYRATSSSKVRLEPANGYNPYWDVRLAPVETSERLIALGLRGDTGGNVLPGGENAEALANYEAPDADSESGQKDSTQEEQATNLPSYAGVSVASAMGLSGAQADAVSAVVAGAPTEFVASAIEGYVPVEEIKSTIKEELEEEVKAAALNFLRAAWNSAVDQASPGVQSAVNTAEQAATGAVALAEDLSEKFETMREEVQREFQAELESRVGEYEEALKPVLEDLVTFSTNFNGLRNEINSYGENSQGDSRAPAALRNELIDLGEDIAAQRAELDRLKSELLTTMTNYLIDRISYHGRDLFDEAMPFDQMAEITNFLLDDYLETPPELRGEVNVDEQLPWGEDNEI